MAQDVPIKMQANTQRTEQTFDLNSLLHTPPCETKTNKNQRGSLLLSAHLAVFYSYSLASIGRVSRSTSVFVLNMAKI